MMSRTGIEKKLESMQIGMTRVINDHVVTRWTDRFWEVGRIEASTGEPTAVVVR